MKQIESYVTGFNTRGNITILYITMISAWILTIPFEGQIIYILASKDSVDLHSMMIAAVAIHFLGLFTCGYFVKDKTSAKRMLLIGTVVCMAGTLVFLLPYSALWNVGHVIISFFAGFILACWSFWFKSEFPRNKRFRAAANVLIYSNLLMILINVIAVNFSAVFGLVITIIFLGGSIPLCLRLPKDSNYSVVASRKTGDTIEIKPIKPMAILYIFVMIITINSGMMYSVIVPAFEHHVFLASWYWAVPYIVALYILKKLPIGVNRSYILTVAITMIGFSYIFYAFMDRSALSYVIIDTMMLGAFGICDLFWWSIIGEMLDYSKNAAKIFGIGLSANILGIIIGQLVSNAADFLTIDSITTTDIAVGVVLLTILMLPILYKQLNIVIKEHAFLTGIPKVNDRTGYQGSENVSAMSGEIQKGRIPIKLPDDFTDREKEIIIRILQGRTYKLIAEDLFISENTVKFHVKNVYAKMGVHGKAELIRFLAEMNNKMS